MLGAAKRICRLRKHWFVNAGKSALTGGSPWASGMWIVTIWDNFAISLLICGGSGECKRKCIGNCRQSPGMVSFRGNDRARWKGCTRLTFTQTRFGLWHSLATLAQNAHNNWLVSLSDVGVLRSIRLAHAMCDLCGTYVGLMCTRHEYRAKG